jgi:hypothetical protein
MVILAGIVAWTYFSETNRKESNFRALFTEIDTARVQEILLYVKAAEGREIKIFRSGNAWRVTNGKTDAPVDEQTVRSLLSQFARMPSKSLAATSSEQWEQFLVGDTSANRIVFKTPSRSWDIMVGKFSFDNETRNASTYVRLRNEKEVYTVEGFLAFTINQPFDSWRDRRLIRKDNQEWTKITFSYPADTSFAILRDSVVWLLRGDTAHKAESYINEIAYLNGNHFAEKPSLPRTPLFRISIDGKNMSPMTVDFFPAPDTLKYYVKSSLNPETIFDDRDGMLYNKLIRSKDYFLEKI